MLIAAPCAQAESIALTLHSPRNLQVVQRGANNQGAILVSGRVRAACNRVEARIAGGSLADRWQRVALDPASGAFRGSFPTPAGGWYRVDVRATLKDKTAVTASVEKVGVGEIFVGAGQSNSTNSGQFKIQQHSGMVSSFSGTDW